MKNELSKGIVFDIGGIVQNETSELKGFIFKPKNEANLIEKFDSFEKSLDGVDLPVDAIDRINILKETIYRFKTSRIEVTFKE